MSNLRNPSEFAIRILKGCKEAINNEIKSI
jgi:hypothetical protein